MEEVAASGRKKRLLRNMLIQPKRQVRITFSILSLGILCMGVLTGYFIHYMSQLELALHTRSPESAVVLEQFIEPMFRTLILCQAVLWIFSILVGVVITHKIFGPLVPILRHIGKLREGDLSSRVRLRGGDEMDDLAQALNGLAEDLEKKGR